MNEKKKYDWNGEDLLGLYQVTIEDIRYLKRLQWTIPYYGLLLLGGILGFYRLINCDESNFNLIETIGLAIAIICVFVLGTIFLLRFQSTLQDYRKRLVATREHFSQDFKNISKIPPNYTSFWYQFFSVVVHLIIILGVGMIFVLWIICRPIDWEVVKMNKIFLIKGVVISFLGVVLMIESKIMRKEGLISVGPIKPWMEKCGWICLILGVISEIIGILVT